MKVFLSWSGDHSHAVAQAFNEWLPSVLQSLTPWLSSEHISKGATWLADVQNALRDSNGVGIFFLTQEALRSEWLLFEAGGIAALDKHRVCTVCIDMQPSDLKPPLNFFQATKLVQADVWKLVKDLNNHGVEPLAEPVLKKTFDRAWPDLEKAVEEAVPKSGRGRLATSPQNPSATSTSHIDQLMDGMRRIELRIGKLEEIRAEQMLHALSALLTPSDLASVSRFSSSHSDESSLLHKLPLSVSRGARSEAAGPGLLNSLWESNLKAESISARHGRPNALMRSIDDEARQTNALAEVGKGKKGRNKD